VKAEPAIAPTLQDEGDDDEIDLLALIGVLWGGKWTIFAVTFLAVLLGAAYYVISPRGYQATSLVQVEPQSAGFAAATAVQDLFGTQSSPIQGEVAIMGSRYILGQAIDKLNLEWKVAPRTFPIIGKAILAGRLPDLPGLIPTAYGRPGDAITVTALQVPARWNDRPITLTDAGGDRFSLALPDGSTMRGEVGKPVTDPAKGFALLVAGLQGIAGRQYLITHLTRDEVMQSLQKSFSVSENPKGSNMLAATYADSDPGAATAILGAITQAYVAQNIDQSSAEAQKSLKFVQSQLPPAKAAVEKAQQALADYQDKHKTVDLSYETQALLTAQGNLQEQLNQIDLQQASMSTDYTVNHPVYQALLQKKKELKAQIAALQKQMGQLPQAQKAVLDLTSNLNVAQQSYVGMLSKVEELKVLSNGAVGNVRIVDVAQASSIPVSPRHLVIVLAGLLGLILGSGIVLGRHALRTGLRGAEDIERLGLPVFATIGHSGTPGVKRGTRGTWPILAVKDPDDPAVEAIRSLRTSLHFGMLDARSKAVLLTSAAPAAGKSFIAINLAVTAAQSGQKVCLVDADMRRGCQRHYLGQPRGTAGLAEVLAGEVELDQTLVKGPADGLECLVSGRFPPNPSELLMREEFSRLLDTLNERFDLIIIDAPPTLAVTDPVIISRSVAATIAVARHMETMAGAVQAVQKTFQSAGARLTGAILNDFQAEKARYGHGYGYAYNYRYSYRRDRSVE
jgi:tyrosine-protein kinase Etk/Wzc